MGVLFWFARRRYLASSREIKRLEAVSRSPVYAEFGATLNGLTTLRCDGDLRRVVKLVLALCLNVRSFTQGVWCRSSNTQGLPEAVRAEQQGLVLLHISQQMAWLQCAGTSNSAYTVTYALHAVVELHVIAAQLDLETAAFLSCTTLVAAGFKGIVDPGLVAFALLYTLSLSGQFQWAVRESAEAENYMSEF
eukprot:12272-Heterococcus_DN1.PRE.2